MEARQCRECGGSFTPAPMKGASRYCTNPECQESKVTKRQRYSRDKMKKYRDKNLVQKLHGTTRLKKSKKNELSKRRCLWCLRRLSIQDVENGYRFYHPTECHGKASNDTAYGFEGY